MSPEQVKPCAISKKKRFFYGLYHFQSDSSKLEPAKAPPGGGMILERGDYLHQFPRRWLN